MYQDVITHPNENVNFWVSHRARGSTEADERGYKYDTMYVVIMPTKLAMTMGDNGTELRTQTELQNFISAHGGFDSTTATSNVEKLTYYDEDSGILIYKISSGETAWHTVNVVNNYKAKGGLTRFFFAAASTAGDLGRNQAHNLSDPPTQGNFIDNVGFSQQLPPTKGFNLTVTETFSGLTMEQLAGLATNAKDETYKVKGITAQAHPLQVTLTNTRANSTESGTNEALSGAVLGFTMGYDTSGNLVLTPTATKNGVDLLSPSTEKPGTSDVHQYSDGRIMITWSFPDQALAEGTGQSTDTSYNYTANDNLTSEGITASTTDINGFTKTTSQNAVDNNQNITETTTSATAGRINSAVTMGSDKTLNIVNVYSPSVHISVRKTFTGVTPTTVAEMMKGTGQSDGKPYSITITKGTGNDASTKVLKVDGGYGSDGTTRDGTVSVSRSQGNDGSTTYKWTITDPNWQDADYTVKEENYITGRNSLSAITLNGKPIISDGMWPSTNQTVRISSDTDARVNIVPTYSGRTDTNKGVITLPNGSLPDTSMNSNPSTNLVVGQYTLNQSQSEEGTQEGTPSNETSTTAAKRYIVWTSSDVGLITRRAIIAQINSIWGEEKANYATASNTTFYSGDNVYVVSDGRIARMVNHQSASLSGQTSNDKWDKFYAAHMAAGSDSSFVDESEIRIENEYTPKIKIQKQNANTTIDVDENETHERLNGAVFRLYKKNGATKLYYQNVSNLSGSDLWKSDGSQAKTFTTARDESLGDGIAVLDILPSDGTTTYYLEEYKAPDGYQKIGDIAFKVRSNGTVALVDESGTDKTVSADDKVQVSFIDPYYTFIINDDPGTALPETGGSGTRVFTILGLILIAGAGIGLIRLQSRKRFLKFR